METLYLSRRNLLALLAKLDRVKAGGVSKCKLLKYDTEHPKYPSSCPVRVYAIEDADYYAHRAAGHMGDVEGEIPIPDNGVTW